MHLLLYVWSAFLFYNRPAVVCKNFSDFNSHHFFDSSRLYFSRAFSLRGSINISQLKLLIFLVKSQNLWNVLKSKHSHRITFEKSCGFIRFIRIGKARDIHPETLLRGTLKGLHRAVRCIISGSSDEGSANFPLLSPVSFGVVSKFAS